MRYVRQDSVIIGPTSGCLRHVTTGLWDSETTPIYSMWCVQAINSQESNHLIIFKCSDGLTCMDLAVFIIVVFFTTIKTHEGRSRWI